MDLQRNFPNGHGEAFHSVDPSPLFPESDLLEFRVKSRRPRHGGSGGCMRYWCLLCVALLFAACSESESSVCGTDTDCKSDQTCSDGVCVTPSRAECTGDPDCNTGEQCIDKTCRPLARFDMGADVTTMPDLGQPDLGEPDTSQEDNINPEVVSITPANGTVDVATDTAITVTFSEDIDDTIVGNAESNMEAGQCDLIAEDDNVERVFGIFAHDQLSEGHGDFFGRCDSIFTVENHRVRNIDH